MNGSMFGIGFLLSLPVLIAQWVGVIAIGKSGRNGAWWCMMLGTALSSLGILASVLALIMAASNFGSPGAVASSLEVITMAILGISVLAGFGSLLFGIGFAMHGLQHRRAKERAEELESVIAAQSEHLERQEGTAQP